LLQLLAASRLSKEGEKGIPKMQKEMTSQQLFSAGHHIVIASCIMKKTGYGCLPTRNRENKEYIKFEITETAIIRIMTVKMIKLNMSFQFGNFNKFEGLFKFK
jgi:hypothetical protein